MDHPIVCTSCIIFCIIDCDWFGSIFHMTTTCVYTLALCEYCDTYVINLMALFNTNKQQQFSEIFLHTLFSVDLSVYYVRFALQKLDPMLNQKHH